MKQIKRLSLFLLMVAMLASIVPITALTAHAETTEIAEESTTEFAGGAGTEDDPYLISTKEHLNNVRNHLSSHFKMINDIEFTDADFAEGGTFYNNGNGWNPIGNEEDYSYNAFSGVFNGDGYAIIGIRMEGYLNVSGSSFARVGLFASNEGKVHDLIIKNIDIELTGGYIYYGGIAALNKGEIHNCCASGNVSVSGYYVGGISGKNLGVIKNCYNSSQLYGSQYLAGIAGISSGTIENCYNSGSVCSTGHLTLGNESYTGGIVAYNQTSSTENGSIQSCYNVGEISVDENSTHSIYAKKLYGISQKGSIKNCYYLKTSTLADTEATGLTDEMIKEISALNGFDFDTVWTMSGDPVFPYAELQVFALSGILGIKGDVAYLSTVGPDLSKINKTDNTFKYEWFIDDVSVGNDASYTLQGVEIGKKLKLKVTGSKEYNQGTLYSDEIVVGKAIQTANPVLPELLYLNDSKFEISTVLAQEYSIDNLSWQAGGVFENLDPNQKYTIYTRILENDLYLLGESTAVLEVTTDRRVLSGAVSISGKARYGDTLTADISKIMPENATYSYEWKANGTIVGTGSTYTITKDEIGKNITVSVKGTGNFVGTLTSSAITATKATVQFPGSPIIEDTTNTTVKLMDKTGYEYSIDGVSWQDSTLFEGLSAATEYTFYQRVKETETTFASKMSAGTKATTLKNSISAPEKPIVENITNVSVTLKKIDGYEYSLDGITWQSNNTFSGLSPNTEYSFCQRIAENATDYASAQSGYTIVTTLKNSVAAPTAPTVQKATDSSVTLTPTSGYEYSMDGVVWQKSNVFDDLEVLKTYTFYQRISETNIDYASPASTPLSFKVKNVVSKVNAPTLIEKTNCKIVIVGESGYEYSIDGKTWSTKTVYDNLNPNTTYSIYARIPETDTCYPSEISDALVVTTLKNSASDPENPVLSSKTDSTVTLVTKDGYEYSIDGISWQKSATFGGLNPNVEYSFYQRIAETNTTYASVISEALVIRTLKSSVSAPSAPILSNKTSSSVTLEKVNGYEYSIDGETWQSGNIFENLSPNTKYNFYQRIAETDTSYFSEASPVLIVTTPKRTVNAPKAPTVESATATTITLTQRTGYEYSMDGVTWQTSNVFSGLAANTTYTFYQRIAETEQDYVSEKSAKLEAKTNPKGECSIIPIAPIISDYTSTTVTLLPLDGYEYSKNGTTWQSSNVFTNLSGNTTYTFYQRVKETAEERASEISSPTSVKTASSNYTTSATNYDRLRSYINNNGNVGTNGNKGITFNSMTSSNGITSYFAMENTDEGILLTYLTSSDASTKVVNILELVLKRDSEYMTITGYMLYYYNGTCLDAISEAKTVARYSYYSTKTYSFTKSGSYIKAADFSKASNNSLNLLTKAFETYIFPKLGFGLKGLGFISYDYALCNGACDVYSDYHCGGTEIRNARPAGCVINGYTGDTYCKGCGEKIKSGTAIACAGSHKYDNSCDTTCNTCSEPRKITHTYSGVCDTSCDVCNASRTTSVAHKYDNDSDQICNVCQSLKYITGDMDGDKGIDKGDAIYLLMNTFFPEDYPLDQNCDFDGNNKVDKDDAIYLLMYTFFPEDYPLTNQTSTVYALVPNKEDEE